MGFLWPHSSLAWTCSNMEKVFLKSGALLQFRRIDWVWE
jgi:hypothetical protein